MAKCWYLAFSIIAVVSVSADGLDDFSNTLATDLGSHLAVFGEATTRQYLLSAGPSTMTLLPPSSLLI